MQTQDLDRIRFVTRHYGYGDLKGLQTVSAGLMCLGLGLGRTIMGALLMLTLIAGSVGLMFFAEPYYRRTFGKVQKGARAMRRNQIFALGTAGVVLLFILSSLALLAVNPTAFRVFYRFFSSAWIWYLFLGGQLLGTWIWRECRLSQLHYLVLGGLLLGLAMPGPSSGFLVPALATPGRAWLLGGTAMILAGLLDHLQLVRILGPSAAVAQDEQEGAEPLEAER